MIPLLSLFFFGALVFLAVLLWLPWTFVVEAVIGKETRYDLRLKTWWGSISLLPFIIRTSRAVMEELRAMLPESGPTHPQDMLEQIFDIVRHLRRQTTRFGRLLRLFVQEIVKFEVSAAFGLADPMITATIYGGVWAFLGPLITALNASGRMRCRPSVTVTPMYNALGGELHFYCIFRIRLGQIIGDMMRGLADSAVQRMQVKEM